MQCPRFHRQRPAIRSWSRLVAAAFLLVVLPIAVARVQGGRPPAPLPQLAALAPLAVIPATAAAILAAVGRARWLVAAAIPLTALLLFWQLTPPRAGAAPRALVATSGSRPAVREIVVATLNAEFGQARAAQVVEFVHRHQVDVLAVQELTPQLVDEVRAAGLGTDLPFSVREPRAGAAGTGIWSRWPLTALPDVPGMLFAAPRALVRPPLGSTFTVTAVHPAAPQPGSERLWDANLAALGAFTRARTGAGPQIILGDFNASTDHARFRDMLGPRFVDALDVADRRPWPGLTWPADQPFPPLFRLDHVLFTPGSFTAASAALLAVEGTDHRGVLAVFRG